MEKQNLFYDNSINSFLFKKIATVALFLSLYGLFYFYSFIILLATEFIERNFLDQYFSLLRVGITIVLSYIFCFLFYDKNNFILSISKLLLILLISSFFSGLLAYVFGNSIYWFLKYLIGVIIGLSFYLLYKKEMGNKKALLSGAVSLFALLLCESLQLFFIMDRPDSPSVLYIKSFLNPVLWFVTIAFVFFSSYFFSTGFRLKKD